MSRQSSSLRVFVNFKDDGVVFAGEDISCTITFKNVEAAGGNTPKPTVRQQDYINETTQAILSQLSAARARVGPSKSKSRVASPELDEKDEERPSISKRPSLRVVESDEQRKGPHAEGFHLADPASDRRHKHSRSVSIISLGSPVAPNRTMFRNESSPNVQALSSRSPHKQRPSLGTRSPTSCGPSSRPQTGNTTPTGFGPLQRRHTVSPDRPSSAPRSPVRSALPSTTSSPNLSRKNTMTRPQTPKSPESLQPNSPPEIPSLAPQPAVARDGHGYVDSVSYASRVLSLRTKEDLPRQSVDSYAHSNYSDETLVSELPPQSHTRSRSRSQRRQPFTRAPSHLASAASSQPCTETLMMGYVQIAGSFILDESLVNQAPFQEVKRKGVVSGQAGGGVVGIARSQSESGLFGALSWSSIGGSIGGLLGSGTPSSIQEMKDIAESKSIPLITTPKSILFVNLTLAPGESKSYSYTFRMPRGLPPSYRGRAMKVSYNIQVVVQRPGHARNQPQQIKQVDIPFRVFSGVNNLGESLDHDVMSPYIILEEQAQVQPLEGPIALSSTQSSSARSSSSTSKTTSSSADFQNYVNHLLTQPRKNSFMGIVSPTTEMDSPSYTPNSYYMPTLAPPTTRTLVDHAIRQSTIPNSAIYSPSRYTIARSGVPIAALMLSRPALKLGDLLTCVLDFADAQLPCYACEATLESSERVDPALAIRSPQSVERATRRVWARTVESCLWARRISYVFQIPVSATPGFGTTGVSLEWCLRLEIVIGRDAADGYMSSRLSTDTVGRPSNDRERTPIISAVLAGVSETETGASRLLDVLSADDRGTVLTAKRRLSCESFEVTIPIRVFGAAVGSGEDQPAMEGLAI